MWEGGVRVGVFYVEVLMLGHFCWHICVVPDDMVNGVCVA